MWCARHQGAKTRSYSWANLAAEPEPRESSVAGPQSGQETRLHRSQEENPSLFTHSPALIPPLLSLGIKVGRGTDGRGWLTLFLKTGNEFVASAHWRGTWELSFSGIKPSLCPDFKKLPLLIDPYLPISGRNSCCFSKGRREGRERII